LSALIGGEATPEAAKPGRRTMSASARRKIAAAQRARWARVRGEAAPKVAKPKKRRMSAAGRAAISAAAKARWARARAAK